MSKVKSRHKDKPVPKKPNKVQLEKEMKAKAKDNEKKAKAEQKAKAKAEAKAAREKAKEEAKAKKKADKLALQIQRGEVLPPMSDDEKKATAVAEDKELRELGVQAGKMSVRMMIILRDFKHYELWKIVKKADGGSFKNWEQWLCDAMPQARSTGFALVKAAEKLLPVIPKDELEQMPARNRTLLSKVPKLKFEKADSPIRKAAKGTEKELRKAIQDHAPEAHLEDKLVLRIDKSSAPVIWDALKAQAALAEVPVNDALEVICVDWLDALCQREDFKGMSNRDAYDELRNQQGQEAEEGEEATA